MANDDGTLPAKTVRSKAGVRRTTAPMSVHNNQLLGIMLSSVRPQWEAEPEGSWPKCQTDFAVHPPRCGPPECQSLYGADCFEHFQLLAEWKTKGRHASVLQRKLESFSCWYCCRTFCLECTYDWQKPSLRLPRNISSYSTDTLRIHKEFCSGQSFFVFLVRGASSCFPQLPIGPTNTSLDGLMDRSVYSFFLSCVAKPESTVAS